MWGRWLRLWELAILIGDTPTCVGKILTQLDSEAKPYRHPHVCGEDSDDPKECKTCEGTPPRVWGRFIFIKLVAVFARDTPTCVGKIISDVLKNHHTGGHPHVCGEDPIHDAVTGNDVGTPPRVWGRFNDSFVKHTFEGDTPTCVGKICSRWRSYVPM